MITKIAVLWDSEVNWEGDEPFVDETFNSSYEYFSESAEKEGGEVYIAKYSWWSSGLEKAFVYRNGGWRKVEDVEIDVVFDKYRFDEETVKLKKQLEKEIPVLNPFDLEKLCKDKLLTYESFPDYVAETYEADESSVEGILEKGKAVLKPRYDFGGKGVEVIDSLKDYDFEEGVLVQKFVDSTHGIPSLGVKGVHDLRVIVMDGEPLVSYIRQPESGLISNVHRGGSMENVKLEKVPEKVFDMVEEVDEHLERYSDRLYSIDFIFDENETPWILELNSKPGLGFYSDDRIASWKKPLIDRAAKKLVQMG